MLNYVHLPRPVLEALLPHGAALQLFCWILSHAHGQARQAVVKGRKLDLKPGEVVLGTRSVGRELGLTHKAVRCALEFLERKTFVLCRGAHAGAQLGAHQGSVVSIVNFNCYGELYRGEGHTNGHTMGHTRTEIGAHQRAQLGAHQPAENVPVIEPPYMQNSEGMGHTTGHTNGRTVATGRPENGPGEAENGGTSLQDINNIYLKNTSNLNTTGISKEKKLKNNCSYFSGEVETPAETDTLVGRKHSISGKRARAFEAFWAAFDHKVGRAQAIDAWAQIPRLTDALMEKILAAARHYAQVERPAILARGGTPKWPQGWINDRRWEDECQVPQDEDYSFLERFGGTA